MAFTSRVLKYKKHLQNKYRCLYSKELLQTYTFDFPTSGNAIRLHEAFSSSPESCKKPTHRNPHKINKKIIINKKNKVFHIFKKIIGKNPPEKGPPKPWINQLVDCHCSQNPTGHLFSETAIQRISTENEDAAENIKFFLHDLDYQIKV